MCSCAAMDGSRQGPCPLGRPSAGPKAKRAVTFGAFLSAGPAPGWEHPLPDSSADAFRRRESHRCETAGAEADSARAETVRDERIDAHDRRGPDTGFPFAWARIRQVTITDRYPGSPAVRAPTQHSRLRDRTSRCRGSPQRRGGHRPACSAQTCHLRQTHRRSRISSPVAAGEDAGSTRDEVRRA